MAKCSCPGLSGIELAAYKRKGKKRRSGALGEIEGSAVACPSGLKVLKKVVCKGANPELLFKKGNKGPIGRRCTRAHGKLATVKTTVCRGWGHGKVGATMGKVKSKKKGVVAYFPNYPYKKRRKSSGGKRRRRG